MPFTHGFSVVILLHRLCVIMIEMRSSSGCLVVWCSFIPQGSLDVTLTLHFVNTFSDLLLFYVVMKLIQSPQYTCSAAKKCLFQALNMHYYTNRNSSCNVMINSQWHLSLKCCHSGLPQQIASPEEGLVCVTQFNMFNTTFCIAISIV